MHETMDGVLSSIFKILYIVAPVLCAIEEGREVRLLLNVHL